MDSLNRAAQTAHERGVDRELERQADDAEAIVDRIDALGDTAEQRSLEGLGLQRLDAVIEAHEHFLSTPAADWQMDVPREEIERRLAAARAEWSRREKREPLEVGDDVDELERVERERVVDEARVR